MPEGGLDPRVQARKDQLKADALLIMEAVRKMGAGGKGDPLVSPENLAAAIRSGILDAPHLKGNPCAAGLLETRVVDGAVYAVDSHTKRILTETERLCALLPTGAKELPG